MGSVTEIPRDTSKPIKMLLRPAFHLGVDLDDKLEHVALQVNKRISIIEKTFLEHAESSLSSMGVVLRENFLRTLESSLENKMDSFLKSLSVMEDASRNSISKIRAAANKIEMAIPGVADLVLAGTIEDKKAKIIDDILEIESEVNESLNKIRPAIRALEGESIQKIGGEVNSIFEQAKMNSEKVFDKERLKLMAYARSAEESAKFSIEKIKEYMPFLEKEIISRSCASIDEVITKKKNQFLQSLTSAENNIQSSAERARVKIGNIEEACVRVAKDSIDNYVTLALKDISYLSDTSLETVIGYLEKIKLEQKSAESLISEKTEAAIDHLLEIKKARFLAGMWVGSDFGSLESPIRDVYMRGEAKGLRLEVCDKAPESSGASIGRLSYLRGEEAVYIDCGWGSKKISSDRVSLNIQWPMGATKVDVDLSNECIDDARDAIFQLCDISNGFERVHCKIRTPDKNKLTIEVSAPLDPAAYRLLGVK